MQSARLFPVVRLREEKDIETVRQAAMLLESENRRLIAKNIELTKKLLELQGAPVDQLRLKLVELEQQLAAQTQQLFGDSSERRPKDAPKKDREPQRGHGPKDQPDLRVVEQLVELGEVGAACCEHCNQPVTEWEGQFEESEEIDIITREFVVKKIQRKKARCECHRTIVTAPAPPKVFPSARYSIDFAIAVVVSKYLDHLPLERQVRIMAREGLDVDSQTLWDYTDALARLLAPAHAQLLRYVLSKPVIGADETWWRLMGAKNDAKRWHVWAACADDAVCYQLEDTRGKVAAEKLLGDYRGIVMCDGYGVYTALAKQSPGFVLAHCWSHVRRKFFEIQESFPEAVRALDLIDELFAIDALCPTGPPGDEM